MGIRHNIHHNRGTWYFDIQLHHDYNQKCKLDLDCKQWCTQFVQQYRRYCKLQHQNLHYTLDWAFCLSTQLLWSLYQIDRCRIVRCRTVRSVKEDWFSPRIKLHHSPALKNFPKELQAFTPKMNLFIIQNNSLVQMFNFLFFWNWKFLFHICFSHIIKWGQIELLHGSRWV